MYLLFDLGKTNLRVAISRSGTKLDSVCTLPSPKTFMHAAAMIYACANELSGEKPRGICGGIGAPLDPKTGRVSWTRPLWNDGSLRDRLRGLFHVPVITENDANLAGLGEAVRGAGKNHAVVAYFTVSSGVGGARIVDKAIDARSAGFEPGSQIICVNDRSKTLEELIGGLSFERRHGKKPHEIRSKKIWDRSAYFLACGLLNATALWSPDVIVIGGSMMRHPGISIDQTRAQFNRLWTPSVRKPVIVRARLGDASGLYGALAHIRSGIKR